MKITKILAAALLASTAAGSAFAADLPSRKAPIVYAAPAPIFTWTGFYIGVNAGYTWSNSNDISLFTTDSGAGGFTAGQLRGAFPFTVASKSNGFIGGGQLGYNWQAGAAVFGIEADIQGLTGGRTNVSYYAPVPAWQPTFSNYSRSLDWLGTVRGRVGFAIAPQLLVYATGGLAYGETKLGFAFSGPTWGPAMAVATNLSKISVGWTAGAGAEYALSNNWSAKVEWLYYDLGRQTTNSVAYVYGAAITTANASARSNGHVVRAGLNYKFGWGGPSAVVAKY